MGGLLKYNIEQARELSNDFESIQDFASFQDSEKELVKEMAQINLSTGLDHLNKIKEETIKKWDALGFLDGLTPTKKQNIADLYEGQTSSLINEDNNTVSSFEHVVFPMVRRVFAKTIASELVQYIPTLNDVLDKNPKWGDKWEYLYQCYGITEYYFDTIDNEKTFRIESVYLPPKKIHEFYDKFGDHINHRKRITTTKIINEFLENYEK